MQKMKGVDFVIASEPLTDKARKEISKFIRNYKLPAIKKITKPKKGINKP